MFQILSWRDLIAGIGGLVAITFLSLMAIDWPTRFSLDVLAKIGQSILISSVLVFFIGQWLWRPIWRLLPFLNRVVFPDVNGVWLGKVGSNWIVIKAMSEAAVGTGGFDGQRDYSQELANGGYPLRFRIRANWFSMSMQMETPNEYSESETLFLVPLRSRGGGPHRLAYIYENRTRNPKPSDEPCHDGAARLSIETFRQQCSSGRACLGMRLKGMYWTNRVWVRGFNTAGLIDVERVNCDPDADVAFPDQSTAAEPVTSPNTSDREDEQS